MTSIYISNAVSGTSRTAASARLLVATRRPWLSGTGVCPSPVQLPYAADLVFSRLDGRRVDEISGPVKSGMPSLTHASARQFDYPRQGSPDLRPPV